MAIRFFNMDMEYKDGKSNCSMIINSAIGKACGAAFSG